MAQELINIGVTADDGTGDTIRRAGVKINNNFTEVYAQPNFSLSQLSFDGNVISATQSNADIELAGNGTGTVQISDLTIDSAINISNNDIKVNDSNADLILTANGTGSVSISSADVNEGTMDNTVIGGTTAAAGRAAAEAAEEGQALAEALAALAAAADSGGDESEEAEAWELPLSGPAADMHTPVVQ